MNAGTAGAARQKLILHPSAFILSRILPAGLEPATLGSEDRYSIQLSYGSARREAAYRSRADRNKATRKSPIGKCDRRAAILRCEAVGAAQGSFPTASRALLIHPNGTIPSVRLAQVESRLIAALGEPRQ